MWVSGSVLLMKPVISLAWLRCKQAFFSSSWAYHYIRGRLEEALAEKVGDHSTLGFKAAI